MADQPVVRVGQVWEICDKRESPPRRLRVVRTEISARPFDRGELVAVCRRVLPDGSLNRRVTRIRIDRFRPTSTGYRLVEDVPAEATA
jgi:hypothetical protein